MFGEVVRTVGRIRKDSSAYYDDYEEVGSVYVKCYFPITASVHLARSSKVRCFN